MGAREGGVDALMSAGCIYIGFDSLETMQVFV